MLQPERKRPGIHLPRRLQCRNRFQNRHNLHSFLFLIHSFLDRSNRQAAFLLLRSVVLHPRSAYQTLLLPCGTPARLFHILPCRLPVLSLFLPVSFCPVRVLFWRQRSPLCRLRSVVCPLRSALFHPRSAVLHPAPEIRNLSCCQDPSGYCLNPFLLHLLQTGFLHCLTLWITHPFPWHIPVQARSLPDLALPLFALILFLLPAAAALFSLTLREPVLIFLLLPLTAALRLRVLPSHPLTAVLHPLIFLLPLPGFRTAVFWHRQVFLLPLT